MFSLRLTAHPVCSAFFFFILVVLEGPCVLGRPPQAQNWPDTGRGLEPQASSSSNPALRFSPELLLEPSLESAASPANVLPQLHPPTPPSASHPTSSNNNNNNNLDSHYNVNNNNGISVVAGDVANDFSQDLDGPEVNLTPDPDVEASEAIPPTEKMSWRAPTKAPQDKVIVPPAVMEDDLNVDRLHGNLLGLHEDDGDEDLGIPELPLKGRDPGSFRSASTGGYVPFPHKTLDQDVSSTELKSGDGDVEAPPFSETNFPMPDDVPVGPHLAVPWEDVVAKDIDVDKPTPQETSAPVPQSASHFPDVSSTHWQQPDVGELRDRDTTAHANEGDGAMASTDMDDKNNPFDEEDEESEVPEELARQVVNAMESPSFWRETAGGDEEEEEGDMWESSGDGQGEEEDYLDYWLLQERDGPWNSRLITLIFQAIEDPEDLLILEDEGLEEEEESADAFVEKLSIWQILSNFPFHMLLDDNDNTMGPINDDYIYDDEDYDEYYDEDYEDEYDDEDDDEYFDEEDENENEDESDDLDDYFYSEDYEDCEDCAEDDAVAKPEIAVLSLPPMLTK